MRIAVIGAGGIGGYFGGRLSQAGHDVTFVARGDHLAAIRRHGLRVRSPGGDFMVAGDAATDRVDGVGPVDVVVVAVKTWQLLGALPLLPPLVGPDTAVLTTQNGVEAPHQVADLVGREAVLPGVAKIFAMVAQPGVVEHRGGPGSLTFAEWDNHPSDRVERMRQALRDSGARVVVPHDIWVELWAKLLLVVPFGELGAALDASVGELLDQPDRRALLAHLMREIEAVARARGAALSATVVEDSLEMLRRQPPGSTASLHRDLVAERTSELDAWTGGVVRFGATSGVDVPLHRLLLELLATRHPCALG